MYMHVSCLTRMYHTNIYVRDAETLYLPAFNTARSRTPIDFYICLCVRACVCQNDDE